MGGLEMRRAVIVTTLAVLAMAVSSVAQGQQKRCCFNNWRYSGTCVVTIGDDQACGDILAALNNPLDVSTYCSGGGLGRGATNIRGGWIQEPCDGQPTGPAAASPNFITPLSPSSMGAATTPGTAVQPRQTVAAPEATTPDTLGSHTASQPTTLKPQQPSVNTLNGAFHGF
jgi:hypothetical protein